MLPQIMREISRSKCYFTSDDKFLTISVTDKNGKKWIMKSTFHFKKPNLPSMMYIFTLIVHISEIRITKKIMEQQ